MERYDYRHIKIELIEDENVIGFFLNFRDIENDYGGSFALLLIYNITKNTFSTQEDDHTRFIREVYGL